MDVVWMAKLQDLVFLRNSKGQSVVEYILLLAVLSSLTFGLLNNKNFKGLINGNKGLFVSLRHRMEYSYRYGRELNSDVNIEDAIAFRYQTNKHDTYFSPKENQSRFFSGGDPYGGD
jgi:hypothetical protein